MANSAIVRIGYPWWLRPFVFRGVIGLALGRRIYVSAEVSPQTMERVIRHELVHVEQAARLGLPRFAWRYIAEYLRHRRKGLSVSDAYAAISFEVEARLAEEPYNRGEFP